MGVQFPPTANSSPVKVLQLVLGQAGHIPGVFVRDSPRAYEHFASLGDAHELKSYVLNNRAVR